MPLNQIFKDFISQRRNEQFGRIYRSLIHKEAIMGGKIFGPLPNGARREFFCLDEHTWVWHEEWIDNTGQRRIVTTRYDVRPSGILKSQNNGSYQELSSQETKRLLQAVRIYSQQAKTQLYYAAA